MSFTSPLPAVTQVTLTYSSHPPVVAVVAAVGGVLAAAAGCVILYRARPRALAAGAALILAGVAAATVGLWHATPTQPLSASQARSATAAVGGTPVHLIAADEKEWQFATKEGVVYATRPADRTTSTTDAGHGRSRTDLTVTEHWTAFVVVPGGKDLQVLSSYLRQMLGDEIEATTPDAHEWRVCRSGKDCEAVKVVQGYDGDAYVRIEGGEGE